MIEKPVENKKDEYAFFHYHGKKFRIRAIDPQIQTVFIGIFESESLNPVKKALAMYEYIASIVHHDDVVDALLEYMKSASESEEYKSFFSDLVYTATLLSEEKIFQSSEYVSKTSRMDEIRESLIKQGKISAPKPKSRPKKTG